MFVPLRGPHHEQHADGAEDQGDDEDERGEAEEGGGALEADLPQGHAQLPRGLLRQNSILELKAQCCKIVLPRSSNFNRLIVNRLKPRLPVNWLTALHTSRQTTGKPHYISKSC